MQQKLRSDAPILNKKAKNDINELFVINTAEMQRKLRSNAPILRK